MFVRRNKNRSGSVSIQITRKINRKNTVVKTIGIARTKREEELLVLLANTELERLQGMQPLFVEHDDLVVENFVTGIANDHLQIVGSELILDTTCILKPQSKMITASLGSIRMENTSSPKS